MSGPWMSNSQIDSVTGLQVAQKSIGGAALVVDQSVGSVRNSNSATDSYDATVKVARTVIVNKQTAVTVGGSAGANDTQLLSVDIVKALTGTCVVTGFKDDAGNAASITLPAATPVGRYLQDMGLNSAGALTVTCSNAADALNVIIRYWPA
jgi:hypothetical protein